MVNSSHIGPHNCLSVIVTDVPATICCLYASSCLMLPWELIYTHSVCQTSFKAATFCTANWYSTGYDSLTVGRQPLLTVVASWIVGASVADTAKWCNVEREKVSKVKHRQCIKKRRTVITNRLFPSKDWNIVHKILAQQQYKLSVWINTTDSPEKNKSKVFMRFSSHSLQKWDVILMKCRDSAI